MPIRERRGAESARTSDEEWDAFLLSSSLGQFQQSSRWATAKAAQGWHPIRATFLRGGELAGGFQMLTRSSRLGRIGYMYKGPVLRNEGSADVSALADLIAQTALTQRLRVLVIQPPDHSRLDTALLQMDGIFPNCVVETISATLQIDLSPGHEQVQKAFSASTRKKVRQAASRGCVAREGTRTDIARFFELMVATCKRQRTKPAPPNLAALEAVWDALEPADQVKLFLAECFGQTVAGLLCICFGDRVVAWKRGWSGAFAERNPNHLVTHEAIRWAAEHGYRVFDFDAVDRNLAEAILRGASLSQEQQRSRDFINLAFGARPVLLPQSLVYIPQPLIRLLYRALLAVR